MAAMLTRNTLFQTSKSFPNVPSVTLPKPSRVFLASNHSDWRNGAEGTKNTSLSWAYTSSTKTRRYGTADKAGETVSAGVDDIKQFAQDANEKTKDVVSSIADKGKENTDKAVEAAGSAGEKAKDFAYDANDKTKEAIGSVADKTKEGFETATKKTEEAAGSTNEALKNAGEQAKEAAEGAWETVKDAVDGKK